MHQCVVLRIFSEDNPDASSEVQHLRTLVSARAQHGFPQAMIPPIPIPHTPIPHTPIPHVEAPACRCRPGCPGDCKETIEDQEPLMVSCEIGCWNVRAKRREISRLWTAIGLRQPASTSTVHITETLIEYAERKRPISRTQSSIKPPHSTSVVSVSSSGDRDVDLTC